MMLRSQLHHAPPLTVGFRWESCTMKDIRADVHQRSYSTSTTARRPPNSPKNQQYRIHISPLSSRRYPACHAPNTLPYVPSLPPPTTPSKPPAPLKTRFLRLLASPSPITTMQPPLTILFLLLLAANPLSASPLTSLATPRTTHLYICTSAAFSGTCKNIELAAERCYNMGSTFDDNVSSAGPDDGTFCVLYS